MWNERFAQPGFLFGTEPARFLVEHENYLKEAQSALAVADGEGRNSIYLAKKGLRVTAFDSSDVALEKAKKLAADHNVEVNHQLSGVEDWDWAENAYDLVVAIFIQFAGPDFRDQIFADMKKALKPGGVLLLHGYTPKQITYGTGGPPFVENMYTEEILQNGFGDMEILELRAYERQIDEGPGHSGMSALIDLVARKR
jgi:cyclopropane fatty-acyl-phospholipid synthase-like methyltransferase